MRALVFLVALSLPVLGQPVDVNRLASETGAALDRNDLTRAADLAAKLDDAVQRQFASWLVRDAQARVDETLRWLPGDTESFWVSQTPFVADAERPDVVTGRANQIYATDRLRTLDGGAVCRRLEGKTIRIVTAGARGLKPSPGGVPALTAQMDIVYFYFFAEALDVAAFPAADLKMSGKPVWKAAGAKEDEHWYALVRPDLLVLATDRALLDAVLRHVAGESGGRAMPASLPEWRLVDRSAGFWGLRHASIDLRLLRRSDNMVTGVGLSYDTTGQHLEIRLLTAVSPQAVAGDQTIQRAFIVDQPEPGLLRMSADINSRGDFPFHYGMMLLGMGEYR